MHAHVYIYIYTAVWVGIPTCESLGLKEHSKQVMVSTLQSLLENMVKSCGPDPGGFHQKAMV